MARVTVKSLPAGTPLCAPHPIFVILRGPGYLRRLSAHQAQPGAPIVAWMNDVEPERPSESDGVSATRESCMPSSTDPLAYELSLDLTAQELLGLPSTTRLVEIDDIRDVDPLLHGSLNAANTEVADLEDSVEIELSAEDVMALLELSDG